VGIVNFSLFALSIVGLYLEIGEPRRPLPVIASLSSERRRLSGRARAAVAVVVVLAVLGAALLAFLGGGGDRPVVVIAHRGSSAAAPENTLAAFRLAADEGADFVELDVQESADGEVLVIHDSDLMKVGGFTPKIWEATAAELRAIDIGSHAGPQFSAERVPTLAESLAICKGRCRVVVELKSYGHDQQLEERVASIVEAAGMVDDCIYMSLDHDMVAEMKRLRPAWRSGALLAKALGDPTKLDADFLAVESKMATRRRVRRAHRAGKDVYVWTLNDPAAMLAAMSHGVDGLITDQPAVAKEVVARRAAMSDAQRLLAAVLIRFGVSGKKRVTAEALRP
jgi:glycerophosphoryl diester phosphodiesterase